MASNKLADISNQMKIFKHEQSTYTSKFHANAVLGTIMLLYHEAVLSFFFLLVTCDSKGVAFFRQLFAMIA